MNINLFTPPILSEIKRLASLKRLVLMAVMLVVTTGNSFAQASFEVIDGIRYLIDTDAKTAAVVKKGDKYSGDIVVPEKVKASDGAEYPVTKFGDEAFKECRNLTSITIPSSVCSLENSCFYECTSLNNITIPTSVTSLGVSCFRECYSLYKISIPSSIKSFGSYCFYNCNSLSSITIPSSVTSVGAYCFVGCYNLTNITIPPSVTYIGKDCFWNCYRLSNINLPSSITSLDVSCFAGCSSLSSITIPSTVTSIQEACFYNSGLCDITIPSSVKYLGNNCFKECTALNYVTFKGECPKNVLNFNLSTTCIIYVPKAYLQDYKDALGSKYSYIYASKDDDSSEDKQVEACATPAITYSNGELQFTSSTDGAQYHYTIVAPDASTDVFSEDGKVQLVAAYNITAYATADGYQTSEKATATLYWLKSNGTLEDGSSTNINFAKTRGIVATSENGIVTLSGLDDNEEVRFYATDGKQIGSVKAIDGIASQAITSNTLVIAKIGGQAIKIAVK